MVSEDVRPNGWPDFLELYRYIQLTKSSHHFSPPARIGTKRRATIPVKKNGKITKGQIAFYLKRMLKPVTCLCSLTAQAEILSKSSVNIKSIEQKRKTKLRNYLHYPDTE